LSVDGALLVGLTFRR